MSLRSILVAMVLFLLAPGVFDSTNVAAQRLPLQPTAPNGHAIVPVMEGWWNNGDGSHTISFGYLNRNRDPLDVPIGEQNSIEPAPLSGMQPTTFLPGRQHGVFTVTVPPEMRETDVWWTIEANEQVTRVPGRTNSNAYELDYKPRPHGTVAPGVWFEVGGEVGQHPTGVVARNVETVRVGELLTLTVHAEDLSVRDPMDRRFREALALSLTWFKHQGPPGAVEWVRDPATPVETAEGGAAGGTPPRTPPANQILLPQGKGTGVVQARFTAPGEYMLRVRADQFASAPDSAAGDQCCWTNGFVRVRVTP